MRPRRTKDTNHVFGLVGGTEDNDLWVKTGSTDGVPFSESYWELDDDDRREIAEGAMIALRITGSGMPPLAMYVGPTFESVRRDGSSPDA